MQITIILIKLSSSVQNISSMLVSDTRLYKVYKNSWMCFNFFSFVHVDHCLETIRLSVMCVPDLTPLELFWESQEGRTWEVAAKSDSRRECVKWDPLNQWMVPRHYNLNDLAEGSSLKLDNVS